MGDAAQDGADGARAPRSRWAVLAAFSAVGACTQLLWLTFAPVTDEAARRYGVSSTAIGWLANVFPLWYVVLAVPAGILLDRRFGAAVLLGASLTAAGGIVRVTGDGYGVLLAGQTLVAFGQPLVLNAITGIAQRHLAPADRANGIALASASTFAGMIAAFALSAASIPHALAVGAVVPVLAALALAVALRTAPVAAGTVHPSGGGAVRTSVRDTVRDPLVRRLCALVLVPFGTFTALTTWAETLLRPAGVSSGRAGVLLAVNIVCGVAGSALLPAWAARRRREIPLMGVALGVTVLACAVLAAVPGFGVALVAFAAFGFLLLATLPVVLEIVERGVPSAEGTAAGLVWLSGQFGALVLTGVIGLTVHHAATSFLLLALVTAAAAVPLLRLKAVVDGRRGPS